jgi:hypothetical protein
LQKIGLIWILIVLSTGCTVLKREAGNSGNSVVGLSGEKLIESLKSQNLDSRGFYISKAEISISNEKRTEKFLGNVKYSSGQFLISLRTKTGIEVARIFISEDTILVNDRINKKLYSGSQLYLKRKYGITLAAIPIIFGDYVSDKMPGKENENCIGGNMLLDESIGGVRISYLIDCRKGKSIKTALDGNVRNEKVEILFSRFNRSSFGLIPQVIQINNFQRDMKLIINIRKLESPWEGKIEFIPGKQYETEQLK